MKTALFRLLGFFAFLITAAQAEEPRFVPSSGLHLSLSTGGYKFFVGDPPTAVPALRAMRTQAGKLGGLLPTNDGFAASVVLANSSRSDVAFEFDDAAAAQVKFHFTVSDSAGTVVWQSDAEVVSAQVLTPATLGVGKRWKRTLQIPLKVNGAWLENGLYTLEATIDAKPSLSAQTIFEVAPAAAVTGDDTGISGHVLVAPASGSPVATKASLTISEIRLPNARYDHPAFSYSSTTDDAGAFKVATPAGRFKVTATRLLLLVPAQTLEQTNIVIGGPIPPISFPPPVAKSVEISVNQGAFTDTTITFDQAGSGDTGVTGTVIGRTLIGETNSIPPSLIYGDKPLAGVVVTTTEIQIPGVLYIRGPWSFTTSTDGSGQFKQVTSPGRYRVSAALPVRPITGTRTTLSTTITINPIGNSAEVTVTQGAFSNVTLRLDGNFPIIHPL